MAQSGSTIKTKLESKIFSAPPASTITIKSISTAQTDSSEYGYSGTTESVTATTTTVGVPYGFIAGIREFLSFGLNSNGEMKIAVKDGTSVSESDIVTISTNADEYEVTEIQEYPYNDINLCRIITVKKKID